MYTFIIALSALLDIVANLLLKKLGGPKNKIRGLAAIIDAIFAFFPLSFSLKHVPLSITYLTWGTTDIIETCFGGQILYKKKLNKIGISGIIIVIITVFLPNY